MEYRLPELSDKELLDEYIKEHLSNGETSISASTGLLSSEFNNWSIKFILMSCAEMSVLVNRHFICVLMKKN